MANTFAEAKAAAIANSKEEKAAFYVNEYSERRDVEYYLVERWEGRLCRGVAHNGEWQNIVQGFSLAVFHAQKAQGS